MGQITQHSRAGQTKPLKDALAEFYAVKSFVMTTLVLVRSHLGHYYYKYKQAIL
jgi:hypothetical protein